MIELQRIEKNVTELCAEVGDFILAESLSFDKSRIEQKDGFNNLVSYVDKESERRIINVLEKLVPGAGFLGEEGTDTKGTNEYRWIIDPLDGTTNFMHGLPPFAISIGLAKGDKMVLGVVHEVTRRECFHASANNPAFCNGREIRVSPASVLSEGLLATGFPYFKFEKMDAYLNIIREFLDKSHGIRRLGSAATDLAYVACGRLEGFFEYNLNSWDVAAGTFLVQQAGGIVTDFKGGNDFIFGGELCTGTKGIHPEMLSIIKKEWNA
ncbi:MAG TPA: inositol monophosphatase family protein [Cyclobacteriaceae bacterium]|jgi:myo-inositol-1(or 4)-monophosphatase|nr:inositol monophosphatase family protein [Cyclobacteriaceae bacterium]